MRALLTSDFCDNYYSVIAQDELSNAYIEIVHIDQTLPSVPSTGLNMVYDDNTNRDADIDDFV